ncbi:hypothetical protein JD474_11055 [Aeromonas caviae]|uniref:hypothetical protein n=1 Tax=Aeromonas caviae TaxID=648 RepID=UPI001920002D|nr:hypothetical protein [Aeromonas caviae]MBL0529618.1 hypothetical protein [Aeromonas caviae]
MRGLIYSSLAAAVIMAMSGTASADYRGDRDETVIPHLILLFSVLDGDRPF